MSDTHSDDEGGDLGLFAEPEGYYQPEKQPTFASHAMQDGRELNLRMVGHNPLWVRVYHCCFLYLMAWRHQGVYNVVPSNVLMSPNRVISSGTRAARWQPTLKTTQTRSFVARLSSSSARAPVSPV